MSREQHVIWPYVVVVILLIWLVMYSPWTRGVSSVEGYECWCAQDGSSSSGHSAGVMQTYLTSSTTTVPGNSDTKISGWKPTLSYVSPTLQNVASVLDGSGQIVIPVKGVYSINFAARFANTGATVQNALWLKSMSGSYGSDQSQNAVRLSQSEALGMIDGNVNFTGVFNAGDIIQPYAWSSTNNNVGSAWGGSSLSIVLITQIQ